MLANSSRGLAERPEDVISILQRRGGWSFEIKLDGIRASLELTDTDVTIRSRRGTDTTWKYPDIVAGFAPSHRTMILDGELVVLGTEGAPDFPAVHRRDTQGNPRSALALSRSSPATFIAFDVLIYDGVDYRTKPYSERRRLLERIGDDTAGVSVFPASSDGTAFWDVVERRSLEGLIAKRTTSPYVGRRSPHWLKIKRNQQLIAAVTGYEKGEGSRQSTLGALHLALLTADGQLRPIGKVGSGFSEFDLRLINGRLKSKDPILVQVEYLELGSSGQLRFPVYKGLASSATLLDATEAQLTG